MAVRKLDVATRKDLLSRFSEEKRQSRKKSDKNSAKAEDTRWKPLVMSSSINPYLCHCRDVKRGFANLCPAHMLTFHLAEAVH
ncbi:MAG: hypothetical protein JSS83_18785 [Cyanobacteria bacterium SZAS LIN-3]|nr:hypothetical protein [Cyanobacteria bacterium SZAS LIN-3]MBS2005953.1 hypothetical protein [Cyanobacteria bacterium SZAS TMP-1]